MPVEDKELDCNKNKFNDARREVAAVGFNAAVRHLCRVNKCTENDVFTMFAKELDANVIHFIEAKKYGVPGYLIDEVLEVINSKGSVKFFRHQLWPNKQMVLAQIMSKIDAEKVAKTS